MTTIFGAERNKENNNNNSWAILVTTMWDKIKVKKSKSIRVVDDIIGKHANEWYKNGRMLLINADTYVHCDTIKCHYHSYSDYHDIITILLNATKGNTLLCIMAIQMRLWMLKSPKRNRFHFIFLSFRLFLLSLINNNINHNISFGSGIVCI